jgi:regulator of sigma E protease
MLTIIVAVISLSILVITHELGHFLTAKFFGIRVDEFGIGYPPKLIGKKFKGTLYSLNLIPFGAFVRIYGHEERTDGPQSFSSKPIWQRMLVVLGGVISFWIISIIVMTMVALIGQPIGIEDTENVGYRDIKVQISGISVNSPAEKSGFAVGDTVVKFQDEKGDQYMISTVGMLQDLIKGNKGKPVEIYVKRGKEDLKLTTTPRTENEDKKGLLGVNLARTGIKSFPWYEAPIKGVESTWAMTEITIDGWKSIFASLFSGKGMPAGAEMRGVVGIMDLSVQAGQMGTSYFMQFMAYISVSLALVNVLPIPALDGGWFVMLVIEAIRKKPLGKKGESIQRGITTFFFLLLISLMLFITIKDIMRLDIMKLF